MVYDMIEVQNGNKECTNIAKKYCRYLCISHTFLTIMGCLNFICAVYMQYQKEEKNKRKNTLINDWNLNLNVLAQI